VFTAVEDVVYVGLGLLLAGCSLALLIGGLISFGQNLMADSLTTNIVALLDRSPDFVGRGIALHSPGFVS
jgi:hypothetical protein